MQYIIDTILRLIKTRLNNVMKLTNIDAAAAAAAKSL